uniref:T9SS type A sorting domain-containing protein n=1 Tax=candidate division WOR-3 bacterium TaxID=2052148 RepID=A0A7V3ZYJ8_UNCW3
MKKLMLVIGLSLAVPLWAEGYNLLLNPGFELWDTSSTGQDSMPKYWHLYIRGTGGGTSGYATKVDGYEGFGVKIVVTGDTSGYDASFYHYVNRIDTLPFADDTFLVSIWIRENSANIGARFWCYWQDSAGNYVGSAVSSGYSTNLADWQEITVKTVRPDTTAVTFKYDLRIYKYSTDEDSVYIDNAYFGPLAPSVSEVLNFNPSVPRVVFNTLPLKFSVDRPVNINISLYGADGRKVMELYNGVLNGTFRYDFPVEELRSGVYFVDVRGKGIRKQYKVIKF